MALNVEDFNPGSRARDGLVALTVRTKRMADIETSSLERCELNMVLSSESRDLARRLFAWEVDAGEASEQTESVPLRVYEKLRQRLCFLAGIAGFHSLASRALTLAKSESPDLFAVQVAPDGSLLGLGNPDVQVRNNAGEGETILIARLLGLLLIFLGEALTLNLISDLWPDATLGDSTSGNGRKA
jgi:hypothetical protein